MIKINIKLDFNIYIQRGEDTAVKPLRTEPVRRQKKDGHLETLVNDYIRKAVASMSRSTIDNYRTAIHSFLEFSGQNIQVSDLNTELFKGYERWLREKGICLNTISCYMRSLRSLLRKVVGDDTRACFKEVFTGTTRTDKRSIMEEDLMKMRKLPLPAGTFRELARDIFLFCFYALGMPFVDVAFLRKQQIKDNTLTYYRHKTGQRVTVHLEPCMQRIIERYQTDGRDYIFPILKSDNPQQAYHEYLMVLNRYNRTLKRLARQAKVNDNLTSYVTRHTWASLAFSSNVDLPVISKALGHTNPQTTLIYIREINDRRLVTANQNLLSKLSG